MNPALAQATLAWLLTYALHSTVLLAATWLVLRSRRFAPAVADVAWKTALVGGLITATVQGLAVRRPAGSVFLGGAAGASAATAATFADPSSATVDDEAGTGPTPLVAADPRSAVPAPDAPTSASDANDANTEPTSGNPSDGMLTAAGPASLLAIVWLVAAFAMVAWYAGRRLVLVGRLGDRQPVIDGPTLAMFEALRRDARARAAVRLTASAAISSPVALGGEICLPAAAIQELDAPQLRAMLAHELAHLERRDPQWLAFACVLERAFFFQPLNRLARRGLQENAEYLADEWAAQHSGGVSLAKALVKVAEWMQASPLGVPVAGFAEERSQLMVRVTRLLDGAIVSPRSRVGALGFAAAALVVTAAFAPGVSGGAAPLRQSTVRRAPATGIARPRPARAPRSVPVPAPIAAPARGGAVAMEPVDASMLADDGRISFPGEFREGAPFADTAIVRAVMQRLRDEDAEVRRAAADALGRMRNAIAIDALVIALDDLDGEVRRAALYALGNFEHARVPAPPIRRMVESPDAEMRAHAIRMLAEMRDRVAVPAITRMLMDEREEVRQAALQALSELDAPVADEVLVRALADRSSEVRVTAVQIAGERQVLTAVPSLIKLLDDRSGDVREQAAQALTEMRTPSAHEALRRALTHKDPGVRRIAVEYFGEQVDR